MYNGADEDRYRYWEETETIDEVMKEIYKLKDELNEQKEIVKILSKEIVEKNDLIQTIKNQKEGV
jgi:uncharacterized phage infection (PIP) family protein YhgE